MEMATKSIVRYIFTILFVSVVCCNCQSDNPGGSFSRAKLPISPDTLSSMEYGNVLVEIYEHVNNHKATTANEKKYFYSPIALLEDSSAVSSYDEQPEMTFSVEMRNDQVENEVVKYLNDIVGHQIKSNQVRVIPLENSVQWLKYELKATAELLRTTVNNLEKTNTELKNVKSELTNKLEEKEKTKIDLEKFAADINNLSITLKATEKELAQTKITSRKELKETTQEVTKMRADLTKSLDALSTKLKATEKELADMKITTGNLSIELKNLKFAEEILKKDLRATSNDLETTKATLASTITELGSTKYTLADLTTKLNARTRAIVDIGQMPTSCTDLQRMGQNVNGFFSVKGAKKMEIVYCNFYPNQNDLQKWIGYADVKSAPVHFYVQKNSSFSKIETPIPFDLAVMNEGNAMNLTSGIFTAPLTGIYFFSLSGVATFPASLSKVHLYAFLFLNGNYVGTGYVEESNTVSGQASPMTLQSTLNLKKGDRVWVQIDFKSPEVILYDYSGHFTHFTGFLLEEEIVPFL